MGYANLFHLSLNTSLKECFRRSLKAALGAALSDGSCVHWLPWVTLGLHWAPEEDLETLPAELVFGPHSAFPGNFWQRGLMLLFYLWGVLFQLIWPSIMHHCFPQSFVPKELVTACFVFVRHDGHWMSLHPLMFFFQQCLLGAQGGLTHEDVFFNQMFFG